MSSSPTWSSDEAKKKRHRSKSRSPTRHKKHKTHKEKKTHHHSDCDENHLEHQRRHRRHHKESRQTSPQSQPVRVKKEPKDDGYEHRGSEQHVHRHAIKQEIKKENRSDRHEGHRKDRRSPQDDRDERRTHERRREERRREQRRNNEAPGGEEVWGRPEENQPSEEPVVDREKPSFELSGKLTEDTNTFHGVVVKYNEPAEARKPKRRWRLYPFKGDQQLPVLHIHRQSAFLMGRDRRVADIPVDHPSCSKQHAALQFRMVPYKKEDGRTGRRVRPYVIDLGSANGTYINNNRIDPQHYVELLEKDVLKFGFSTREYVILHDKADTSELLSDVEEGEEA